MDASPLPVLVHWADADADAGSPADGGTAHVPGGLPRVDVVASSADDALRRAAAKWPGRDLLLLHTGTTLGSDAWRRLMAAWHDGDWDVLSPCFAAPDVAATADAVAWTRGEHVAHPAPEGSTHCALW